MFKAYLTHSLEELRNEVFIGEYPTEEAAFKAAFHEHKARGYHVEPYTRGLIYPNAIFYDVGSYCHFIAIYHS